MRRNPRVESAESCGRWAAEQWPGNKELYRDGRGRSGARHPVWRAHRREQVRRKRMPMLVPQLETGKINCVRLPRCGRLPPGGADVNSPIRKRFQTQKGIADPALRSVENFHRCVAQPSRART